MKTFVALTFGDNTVASVISYGFSIVKLAAMFETGGVLQARSDMQTYSLLSYLNENSHQVPGATSSFSVFYLTVALHWYRVVAQRINKLFVYNKSMEPDDLFGGFVVLQFEINNHSVTINLYVVDTCRVGVKRYGFLGVPRKSVMPFSRLISLLGTNTAH